MKLGNHLTALFRTIFFSLCLTISSASAFADQIYAQLSSFTTQIPTNNSDLVIFENSEIISGLRVDGHKKITIREEGLYIITLTGQAGAQGLAARGNVNLWVNRNGRAIAYTKVGQTIENRSATHSMTSQSAIFLKKGDTITIGISSDFPSIGIIGEAGDSPSAMLTIFKL